MLTGIAGDTVYETMDLMNARPAFLQQVRDNMVWQYLEIKRR